MSGNFTKRAAALLTAAMSFLCLGVPVFAGIPATGDGSGMVLPIMGGLLAVSVVLIIVYAVLSAKKKKK